MMLPPSPGDPRIGIASRAFSRPGVSHCYRCRTTWDFVAHHSTMYRDGSGLFALCEGCWAELTPEQRLPFYFVLHQEWEWDARLAGYERENDWPDIEKAVLAGL